MAEKDNMLTKFGADALKKAVNGLESTIRETIDVSLKADKASLALGMSFQESSARLSDSMAGLRGGLDETFTAALETHRAGLVGNTRGIAQLLNQQRLTGTSTAKTMKAFTALEAELNISREATNAMGASLIDTGRKFSVSTDVLVGAIDAMSQSFGAMDMAGMGENVITAVAELQANLGPQLAGPLNNVMKAVMDTSEKGYERLVRMGIGDLREQLSASRSSAEAQQILKRAIQTATGTIDTFGSGTKDFFRMAGVTQDLFGRAAFDFRKVSMNLDRRASAFDQAAGDFSEQIGILKQEALLPFQELFADLYNQSKDQLPEIFKELREGFQVVANKIRGFVNDVGGLSGILNIIKNFVVKVSENLNLLGYAAKIVAINMLASSKIVSGPVLKGWTFAVGGAAAKLTALGTRVGFFSKVLAGAGRLVGLFSGPVGLAITAFMLFEPAVKLLKKAISFLGGGEDVAESVRENNELTTANLDTMVVQSHDMLGYQRRTAEATEKAAEIQQRSASDFLGETAISISRDLESIIGVRGDSTAEELVELMREQNEMIATADRGTRLSFSPQDSARD